MTDFLRDNNVVSLFAMCKYVYLTCNSVFGVTYKAYEWAPE